MLEEHYMGLWGNDKRPTLAGRHKQEIFGLYGANFKAHCMYMCPTNRQTDGPALHAV